MTWREELGWEQPDGNNLMNDEDFDAVADEREEAFARDQDKADLRSRAAREPLGVDISGYSDEYCAGFLAGQVNALEELDR